MTRPGLVVLAPIAPAATGNGLAMRCRLLAEAAGIHHDVHAVVVPVAGRQAAAPDFGPGAVSVLQCELPRRNSLVPWLSDPVWRERLERLAPLPAPVLAAPPSLAVELSAALSASGMSAVLALRLSLGPLGLALAEALGARLIVDADDDDADYCRQSGRPDEALAWERVAQLCLPDAALVTASSAAVASALTARHHLGSPVRVVPNAVHIPAGVAALGTIGPTRPPRILEVANFTYAPNVAGARWLVHEVQPLLHPSWTIDLVGAAAPGVQALAGPTVVVRGWVPDVRPHYEGATVAAVPVLTGSGTRIKLLEAMAMARPAVTTTIGAAGLDIRPGVDALVADDPPAFAAALRSTADPATARALVEAASRLVREQYHAPVVATAAADLLFDATHP
jgi:glycosyltransferase involved in cell wall biosynthesis